MSYVGLHTHLEWSALDGLTRIPELVQFAVDNDQKAVACTDHGKLQGAVKLYESATAAGIKSIIGSELYVERDDSLVTGSTPETRRKGTYHLIALAANNAGYHNLCNLITRANLENFYYQPLVTHKMLAEHNEGLIVLSGCLGSEVSQSIVHGGDTVRIIEQYREIFGDRYFLEIQSHGIPEEDLAREELARLSSKMNIPLVATQDSHFTFPHDADVHDTMLSIQVNKRKDDPDRFHFSGSGYHLATEVEMQAKFGMYPGAVSNSGYIADVCNVELELNQNLLPLYNNLPSGYTASEYLQEITMQGMQRRYGEKPSSEAMMRMFYELEVIERTGFDAYMLIIADLQRQARCDGVRTGPGRGSSAGSIVSYALGITNVCPLKYGLIFERFLNLERIKQPDIDLDYDDRNRDKVIKYAANTYGTDKVAQIATIGTLAARSAVKAVAKSFGIEYTKSDNLAKSIGYDQFGSSLGESLKTSEDFAVAYNRNGWEKKVIDTAMRLEGVARNSGTHAAGVVVSPVPLRDVIPLQRPSANDVTEQIAHFEMDDLAKIGLLKIDFLGLSTLTLIGDTLDLIESRQDLSIDIDKIVLDDTKTFSLLQRGDTHGVFQLESYGARKVLSKVRPTNIDEISACIAINRPGPLQSGVVDLYVARKENKPIVLDNPEQESVASYPDELFPELKETLTDTYGTIVYQESIMRIAQDIAGYTLGEADLFRESIGKKDLVKMAKQKRMFTSRAIANGHDAKKVKELIDLIEPFAGYGFNKSHAITYAVLAYQTAWLRANHALEFTCALLNMRGSDKDKLPWALKDARINGITVLGPDVHKSQDQFMLEGDAIRYGLLYVKDFGTTAYATIDQQRKRKPFESLEDMLMRCNQGKLNSKAVTVLIKTGALRELGPMPEMLKGLELTLKKIKMAKEDMRRIAEGRPPVKRRKPLVLA